MAYTVDTSLHCRAGRYTVGGNSCRYIVVHYTANTATARQEAANVANNFAASSFHYVLDDTAIFRVLEEHHTAWAVGAWSGARQLIGNDESINIEVCNDGGPFSAAEIDRLHWLVREIMERRGIPAANVVRHYDCHTGHKACPAGYVDAIAWRGLWQTITAPYGDEDAEEEVDEDMSEWFTLAPGDGATYLYEPAGGFHPMSSPDELKAVQELYRTVEGKEIPGFALPLGQWKLVKKLLKRNV